MLAEIDNLPSGSKISVKYVESEIRIEIPFRRFFAEKVVQAVFPLAVTIWILLFLVPNIFEILISTSFGWISVAAVFSLVIVLLLGLLPIYGIFKMPLPQRINLLPGSMLFETGGTPPVPNFPLPDNFNKRDPDNSIFSESERFLFNLEDIKSIRLVRSTLSSRLVVCKDGKEYEIAPTATLMEKRWLYSNIRLFYKLD